MKYKFNGPVLRELFRSGNQNTYAMGVLKDEDGELAVTSGFIPSPEWREDEQDFYIDLMFMNLDTVTPRKNRGRTTYYINILDQSNDWKTLAYLELPEETSFERKVSIINTYPFNVVVQA